MKVLKRVGTIAASVILWIIILVAALYAFTTMATKDHQNVLHAVGCQVRFHDADVCIR